jgi:hypothetical protein
VRYLNFYYTPAALWYTPPTTGNAFIGQDIVHVGVTQMQLYPVIIKTHERRIQLEKLKNHDW